MSNIFKGLIKCLNCGKNFKLKMERKQPNYICGGFSNYGKEFCERFSIKEEELIYTIVKHYEIQGKKIEGNVADYVSTIEVKDRGYKIYYKDGSHPSIINNNEEEYGVKVKF